MVDNEPHFIVQEEETQKETSESDGFNEADVDDIPTENYKEESKNQLRASRQPLIGSNKRDQENTSNSNYSLSTLQTRQ